MTRNPGGLDVHAIRNSANWYMALPQMNYLLQNWQFYGQLTPDLAERWEVSADGKTYTFFLVKNAKWHDGKPFTADDVVYSIRRIKGLEDLKAPAHKATVDVVQDIQKVDQYTVKLTLSQPSAAFLPSLGVIGNVMYPKHVAVTEFQQNRIVGTGGFKLKQFTSDVVVEVEKNTDYFKQDAAGRRLPYLDKVVMYVIPDTTAAYSAMRTNQIDLTFYAASPLLGRVAQVKAALPDVQLTFNTIDETFLLNNKDPFTDIRVRKAFQLAHDREDWEQVMYQREVSAYVLFNMRGGRWAYSEDEIKKMPGFNPDTKKQDIAEANRLLDEFLAANNLTRSTFSPSVLVQDFRSTGTVAAATIIGKNLGITVKVKVTDQATHQQAQVSRIFEILDTTLAPALDDPSVALGQPLRKGSGFNVVGFDSPEIEKLLDQIDSELDVQKRLALSRQAEVMTVQQYFHIFLGNEPRVVGARGYVKGQWQVLHSQDGPPYQRENQWLDK